MAAASAKHPRIRQMMVSGPLEYIVDAPDQYRELLDYTARTVLELRLKLPPEIAVYLPEGAAEG